MKHRPAAPAHRALGDSKADRRSGEISSWNRQAARNGKPECKIIDAGHRRDMDLAIELPQSPLEAVMSNEVWEEVYRRLGELIEAHRTTLVFVNTRRLAERVTAHLCDCWDGTMSPRTTGAFRRSCAWMRKTG